MFQKVREMEHYRGRRYKQYNMCGQRAAPTLTCKLKTGGLNRLLMCVRANFQNEYTLSEILVFPASLLLHITAPNATLGGHLKTRGNCRDGRLYVNYSIADRYTLALLRL